MFFVAAQALSCEQAYIRVEYDLKDFPSINIDAAKVTVENVVNGQLNTGCIDSMDEPAFDPCWYSKDGHANRIVCPFRLFRVSKGCALDKQLSDAFVVHSDDGSFTTAWRIIEIQPVGDVHCG